MSKTLIAYFSASGETARLAKTLAGVTGGDLFEIKPQTNYTAADLNWNDSSSRSTLEMKGDKSRPGHGGPLADVAQYDVVFVGFPIWWYHGSAHHRDLSGEPRLFRQDRRALRHLRRQRHGQDGKHPESLLCPDCEMAPRQATQQPGKRRVRPEMGGQSGAVKGE